MFALKVNDFLYAVSDEKLSFTVHGTTGATDDEKLLRSGTVDLHNYLYRELTAPSAVTNIHLKNSTANPATLDIYLNGLVEENIIYSAVIDPGGTLLYGEEQWIIYDEAGIPKSTVVGTATLSDGDYGDVTVSGGGLVITIDSGLSATVIGDGSVDNTEFQYLDGTTSNIQTQINDLSDNAIAFAVAL